MPLLLWCAFNTPYSQVSVFKRRRDPFPGDLKCTLNRLRAAVAEEDPRITGEARKLLRKQDLRLLEEVIGEMGKPGRLRGDRLDDARVAYPRALTARPANMSR